MNLNSPWELDSLAAICRPLSKEGLQDVIDHAIALYMGEQGIQQEDIRKLPPLTPIPGAFVSAAFAPRDPGFQNFLRAATAPPAARPRKRRR